MILSMTIPYIIGAVYYYISFFRQVKKANSILRELSSDNWQIHIHMYIAYRHTCFPFRISRYRNYGAFHNRQIPQRHTLTVSALSELSDTTLFTSVSFPLLSIGQLWGAFPFARLVKLRLARLFRDGVHTHAHGGRKYYADRMNKFMLPILRIKSLPVMFFAFHSS